MLCTHLNTSPPTKLLIIEDNLRVRGEDFLHYLLGQHRQLQRIVHYYVFSGNFRKNKPHNDFVQFYDFSDSLGLCGAAAPDLKSLCRHTDKDIVVIDSLAHLIHLYGVAESYKILHKLKTNCQQVICILHADLLTNDDLIKYYKHLSTFYITLEHSNTQLPRTLEYVYKKPSGKIIKEIEHYHFQNGFLITEQIKQKINKLTPNDVQLLPEDLTTFKIALGDRDKQSRDELVLPYLPKNEEEGSIFYKFDQTDDWDEEDPDDDLDI